jgi:hypothetical protein
MSTLALAHPASGTFGSMIRPRETTTVVSGSLTLALFLLGRAPTSNSFPEPVKQARTSATPSLVVDPPPAVPAIPEAIFEMRRISGLTWDELAHVFGVTRRAIHHWANGHSLKPENIRQVHDVLHTLRIIARSSAEETRAALLAPLAAGRTPLQLLQARDFNEVLALLGAGERSAFAPPGRAGMPVELAHPTAFLSGLQDRPVKPATRSRVAKTIRTARAPDPQ